MLVLINARPRAHVRKSTPPFVYLTCPRRSGMAEAEDSGDRSCFLEGERTGSTEGSGNEGREELLQLVEKLQAASSAERMSEEGTALVEKVKTMKLLERQSILEKIQLLTQERDNALAKKQSLEVEISRLLHQLDMMETEYRLVDKTRVKTLQTQLQAALNEKDAWQQKAAKFEDTCETLKIISSLQKSMYKEDDVKRKYEAELLKLRAEKKALVEQLEHTLQERNHAVQERNMLIQERNALALQYQQEFERAERFQRLVLVLRKKAMCGTGDSAQH